MAAKQRGRAGHFPARPDETHPAPAHRDAEPETIPENSMREDDKRMLQPQGPFSQTPREGVTVIGEAVRRVQPENAEILLEITAVAPTAAQALHDSQSKASQVAQAVGALGVQPTDIQTISLNVASTYSPMGRNLAGSFGVPQIGTPGYSPAGYASYGANQPEMQYGAYHARHVLRVSIRQAARVGEVVDTAARAGATVANSFSFQAADETATRRALLEAAGKDARGKAEALAAAAGRQIGEPVAITEDCIVSNGAYAVLRSAAPVALGSGPAQVAGELEYYARVTACFRFQ